MTSIWVAFSSPAVALPEAAGAPASGMWITCHCWVFESSRLEFRCHVGLREFGSPLPLQVSLSFLEAWCSQGSVLADAVVAFSSMCVWPGERGWDVTGVGPDVSGDIVYLLNVPEREIVQWRKRNHHSVKPTEGASESGGAQGSYGKQNVLVPLQPKTPTTHRTSENYNNPLRRGA